MLMCARSLTRLFSAERKVCAMRPSDGMGGGVLSEFAQGGSARQRGLALCCGSFGERRNFFDEPRVGAYEGDLARPRKREMEGVMSDVTIGRFDSQNASIPKETSRRRKKSGETVASSLDGDKPVALSDEELPTRLNLGLSRRAAMRLVALRYKTDASSNADVLREALRLYDALVEEADRGNEFFVKDKTGSLVKYRLFY